MPAHEPALRAVRVLLAADEPDTLQSYCDLVAAEGAETYCLPTGAGTDAALEGAARSALADVRHFAPDVVVCDLERADDASMLVTSVSEILGRPVPVVCVYSWTTAVERRQTAFCARVLRKPADPDELVRTLRALTAR